VERLRQGLAEGTSEPLDMPGRLITIDTSHFEAVKVDEVVAEIEMSKSRR